MSDLVYGCCVGSWDRFNQYVVPRTQGREVIGISGQTSIAVAYNKIRGAYVDLADRKIQAALTSNVPTDIQSLLAGPGSMFPAGLVLVHDDLEILDQAKAEAAILEAFLDPEVALVGVAGGDARSGLAWWNIDPIGHQLTDSMNIDFGRHTGDVILLEGSLLALSPWAIGNLEFDEDYPGFHGYDEIAIQAIRLGKRVVVVDVDTHHHSTLGFDSLDSHAEWHRADERFRKKWGL